jgi:hypothetical protein
LCFPFCRFEFYSMCGKIINYVCPSVCLTTLATAGVWDGFRGSCYELGDPLTI